MINNVIYCFWTGDNEMSPSRKKCFDSMSNSGCEIKLITPKNLNEFIKPGYPLHEAYQYLSLTHKSDYLRCYFMHHYGGGYSDIKEICFTWNQAFKTMNNSSIYINGYQELSPNDVAKVGGQLYLDLQKKYKQLIGCCSFICKPYSPFTLDWIEQLHHKLDFYLPTLIQHPAKHPQEQPGMIVNGKISKYPIPWTDILGNIFHPLCLKYHNNIGQTVPMFKPGYYR